ncbi:MAG: aminoglycoside adenylyltransferase domain-containing protein [Bacillota bacterium]
MGDEVRPVIVNGPGDPSPPPSRGVLDIATSPQPTSYPDINALLLELVSSVRTILRNRFIGMYLHGSLAIGDFMPDRSDIDFLVVTDGELSDGLVAALHEIHARIATGDSPWAKELEGSYIPRDALRRHDPANARHPHIEQGGSLRVEQHDSDWVVQRHVLREHGVTLAGPPLHSLIDPIGPDALRRALVELTRSWWAPMVNDPTRLLRRGYQAYAVLTMGRILYTLEHGTVVSKPVAARWARQALGQRWSALLDRALAGPGDDDGDALDDEALKETQRFIQYASEQCRRWSPNRA